MRTLPFDIALTELRERATWRQGMEDILYSVSRDYIDVNGYDDDNQDFIIFGISLKEWCEAELFIGRTLVEKFKGSGYLPFIGKVYYLDSDPQVIAVNTSPKCDWALHIVTALPRGADFKWRAEES